MSIFARLVAATTMIGLVGLAGCGSDDGGGVGSSTLPDGFTALTTDTLLDRLTAAMTQAETATFEIRAGASGAELTFNGAFRVDEQGLDVRIEGIPGEQGELTGLLLDGALYLSGSDLGLPEGKTWLKISEDDAATSPEFAALFQTLGQSADPQQNLGILAAATSLQFVRSETRDGVELARYEGGVDVAEASARDLPESIKGQIEAMSDGGVDTVEFVILVDKDNLLHRFETGARLGEQQVVAEADYRDWGRDVTIDAPDPAAVVTISELTSG